MQGRVYETVRCPSVRPPARLSVLVRSRSSKNTMLLVCCCGPGGQKILMDCCSSGLRWTNADSATLSAYVGNIT